MRLAPPVMLEPMDVLVVDDDEILLETAVDTLESLGVTAECARSGREALDMITRRRHDGGRVFGKRHGMSQRRHERTYRKAGGYEAGHQRDPQDQG